MDKKGFIVSIPQMLIGIFAIFIAMIAFRVFSPIIFMVLGLAWKNANSLLLVKVTVWLISFFIIYFIVYGMIMGKKPNILGENTPALLKRRINR